MRLVKPGWFCIVLLMSSCDKDTVAPAENAYAFEVPPHFPVPVLDGHNPMTAVGIRLGRQLFYDPRLSANNKVSCASCHDPAKAFSDGVALSTSGVSGTQLLRHAPALFNLAWATNGLFWDGGSTNLESQAFGPLTAHDEMAQDLYELVDELNADASYVKGFQEAFSAGITSQNVAKALAQFQRSLVSATSRYDDFRLGRNGAVLTPEEMSGLALVRQHCQGCHSGELFTDNGYHNNGLNSRFDNQDHEGVFMGRYRISYDEGDLGKFKTPSLRNVTLTAPYMHDGRISTLEKVLDHYSNGIQHSATLDGRIPQKGFAFSAAQKTQIIAFLATLTDERFASNPAHQKPH